MNNEPIWQKWFKALPTYVKGSIAFITAIIAFIIFLKTNIYLGVTVLVGISFIAAFFFFLVLAFSKTPPLIQGGKGVYRFESYRSIALVCLVIIPFLIVILLGIKPTRDFAMIAFLGTPTSTYTPTPTATQTPTITPTTTPTPLVELAAINIESTSLGDSKIFTAELSIEPLEYGDLHLESPAKILLGESEFVRLVIMPDSALEQLPKESIAASEVKPELINSDLVDTVMLENRPDYTLKVDDRIQVYPIMSAELSGVNFKILPTEKQTIAIVTNSPVELYWSITPLTSGNQTLVLTISIPVIIQQQVNQLVTHPLKNIPLEIMVYDQIVASSEPRTGFPSLPIQYPSISPLDIVASFIVFIALIATFFFIKSRGFGHLHPMSGIINIYEADKSNHYELALSIPLPKVAHKDFSRTRKYKSSLNELGISKLIVKCPDMVDSEKGIVIIEAILLQEDLTLFSSEFELQSGSSFELGDLRIEKL